MLDEIYEREDDLTEEEYYDALVYVFGDVYPDLSEEEIEEELEDFLDQLPENYAEGVLDTISNVGKKIGSGALQFSANNPDLVRLGATAAGALAGGPIGAKAGSMLGSTLAQKDPKSLLPQVGKTLSIMQNPQAQSAVARAALGLGNGTAPLTLNNNTNLIPVATYLRALISSAQSALRELDQKKIIPPAVLSESMPYPEDVDMQADWLVEQLTDM